ncbi:hypothetical protein F5Y15DRAFT_416655 [Xylariaceae sp. FL0016]|nr:hypothetical protein F5Y15DRAFT_416655 [Xylariaceae sp. FL0016]
MSQTCYLPDGTEKSDHQPCSEYGGACCYWIDDGHHDLCYSNGLCQSQFFGYIYRGACTDQGWGSSCSNICRGGGDDDPAILRFCSEYNGWCCQYKEATSDCCATGSGFAWDNATLVNYNIAPEDQVLYEFDLSNANQPISATSTSTSTSTASDPPSTTSTDIATPSPTMYENCSPSSTIALGIGLGIGLGVPLAICVAVLIWLVAKRRYEQRRPDQRPAPSTDPMTTTPNHFLSAGHTQQFDTTNMEGRSRCQELGADSGRGPSELGQENWEG